MNFLRKPKFLTTIVLLLAITVQAQDCNCESNYEWVKNTFEKNDAGFQYAVDRKGKEAYEKHCEQMLLKIKKATTKVECTKLLYEWMTFFRSGHIAIKPKRSMAGDSDNEPQTKSVSENWETIAEKKILAFENKIQSKKEADYEGIWFTDPYTIGIQKKGDSYIGFIITTTAETWKRGEIKLRFSEKEGVFYMRDKSEMPFSEVKLIGKNHLQLGNRFLLKREKPLFEEDHEIKEHFRALQAKEPYLEALDDHTLFLRIPSFSASYKKAIDSVILKNKDKIQKTENLIIDVRNNGGGSDGSFAEILPLLYTNPIRTVGVEFYSTELNNKRMLDFINDPKYGFDEEDKKWAKSAYDELEKSRGHFVNLNDDNKVVSIKEFDTVYPYPENVGIIINNGNGSTTEQFLLAAKQSKKVKLFGTTTLGVLDISNMYFINSPCDEFELGYCLSRSMRIPDMTIDEKGIQPDYYIDKSIPDYQWIKFVEESIKQHQSKNE